MGVSPSIPSKNPQFETRLEPGTLDLKIAEKIFKTPKFHTYIVSKVKKSTPEITRIYLHDTIRFYTIFDREEYTVELQLKGTSIGGRTMGSWVVMSLPDGSVLSTVPLPVYNTFLKVYTIYIRELGKLIALLSQLSDPQFDMLRQIFRDESAETFISLIDKFKEMKNLGKAFHWEISPERADRINRLIDSTDPAEKEQGRLLALEERRKTSLDVFYKHQFRDEDQDGDPEKLTFAKYIDEWMRNEMKLELTYQNRYPIVGKTYYYAIKTLTLYDEKEVIISKQVRYFTKNSPTFAGKFVRDREKRVGPGQSRLFGIFINNGKEVEVEYDVFKTFFIEA